MCAKLYLGKSNQVQSKCCTYECHNFSIFQLSPLCPPVWPLPDSKRTAGPSLARPCKHPSAAEGATEFLDASGLQMCCQLCQGSPWRGPWQLVPWLQLALTLICPKRGREIQAGIQHLVQDNLCGHRVNHYLVKH